MNTKKLDCSAVLVLPHQVNNQVKTNKINNNFSVDSYWLLVINRVYLSTLNRHRRYDSSSLAAIRKHPTRNYSFSSNRCQFNRVPAFYIRLCHRLLAVSDAIICELFSSSPLSITFFLLCVSSLFDCTAIPSRADLACIKL